MKLRTLLLLAPSLLLPAATSTAEVIDRVIAKVNGEIISLSELQARQLAALREAHIPPEGAEAFLRQNSQRLLQEAIDDLLIAQKAEEEGDSVPAEYVKQIVEQIKKDHNLASDEELQRELRREGLTIDELKHNIQKSLLTRNFLRREVEVRAQVTDAEARAEYEARKDSDYSEPATEHLQEIVISRQESNAQARAAEILARARAGEDFAELARKWSAAPSRDAGGDLGSIARRDMQPGLLEAVAKLKPGEISDPLPTAAGLRILRLVAREEGKQIPFDQVKDKIIERLTIEKRTQQLDKVIAKLRETALIQDMVREVPLQVQLSEEGAPSLLDATAPTSGAFATEGEDEVVSKPGRVTKVSPEKGSEAPPPAPAEGTSTQP